MKIKNVVAITDVKEQIWYVEITNVFVAAEQEENVQQIKTVVQD